MDCLRSTSLVTCLILCSCISIQADDDYLHAIVDALKLSLQFYADNYMHMNIDGIFGLRIVEGQLTSIVEQLKLSTPTTSQRLIASKRKNGSSESSVVLSLNSLRQQAMHISELAQTALQRNDEHYYKLMQPLIHRPWLFAKEFAKVQIRPELRWLTSADKNSDTMSEERSDKCMAELMGTVSGANLCTISSECISVMSMSGRSGYHLTHQLLYGIIAEQYGCLTVLNLRLGPAHTSIEKLRAVLCTNNFYEVSRAVIKNKGDIPPNLHDLFMEQEFVCPNLGYVEFLHSNWLQQILSWQKPSGCWGVESSSKLSKNGLMAVDRSEAELQDSEPVQLNGLEAPRLQTRKLLYEITLDGGCLAHKTAVALGCLMQYLRFILVGRFFGLNADQHLQGVNYLMNPAELLSTTAPSQLEDRRFNVRSDLLVEDEKYAIDERKKKLEVDDAEHYDQERQVNYPDNNAEIELREDNSLLAKNSESNNEENDKSYGSDNNGVMRGLATERGVFMKYRSNNRMVALDDVLSSLTSLFAIMIVITFLIVALLFRLLHCRLHHLCRIYRLFRW